MATQTFNVSSNAQPGITVNHMVYALYKQSDLGVIVTSQAFSPPHAARTVSFPGLDLENYRFRLLETLPDNVTIVRELDYFDFVPGDNSINYRPPEEIQVDFTPGLTNGTNTFTFDGSAGSPDWRGWEIYVERVGSGTIQRDVEYTWNKTTGIFTFIPSGLVFQPSELFNVEFGLILTSFSGVPTARLFSGTKIITGTDTLTAADAGKNIIIEGLSDGFDITLPDITGVAENVPFYFESGIGAHKCVRIKSVSGQIIKWLKGTRTDMKIGVCESLVLYKQPSTSIWRVHRAEGNFDKVGRIIRTDAELAQEFNVMALDGSTYSITGAGRRLYEDFVQKLPPSQVCSYADHAANPTKFSYASGDNAYLPDRRNLFARNSDGTVLPGVYSADKVGPINGATMTITKGYGYTGGPNNNIFGNGFNNQVAQSVSVTINTGNTETVPKHYVSREFVLV